VVLVGIREGMTTGAECIGAGEPVGADFGVDMFPSLFVVGLEVRGLIRGVGDGLADLVPIFSELFREGGDDVDGCRKG
jgi:hypothetical protein